MWSPSTTNRELFYSFRKTKTDMTKGQILDLENEHLEEAQIVEKCCLNNGCVIWFHQFSKFVERAPVVMSARCVLVPGLCPKGR